MLMRIGSEKYHATQIDEGVSTRCKNG